jgi:hypothetical protein
VCPLSTPIKIEDIKDSPSPEELHKTKGKSPQKETTPQGEKQLPLEGTSKAKTPAKILLYATFIELEKIKVEAIKWKRMVENSKGKQKEEAHG